MNSCSRADCPLYTNTRPRALFCVNQERSETPQKRSDSQRNPRLQPHRNAARRPATATRAPQKRSDTPSCAQRNPTETQRDAATRHRRTSSRAAARGPHAPSQRNPRRNAATSRHATPTPSRHADARRGPHATSQRPPAETPRETPALPLRPPAETPRQPLTRHSSETPQKRSATASRATRHARRRTDARRGPANVFWKG